MLDQLGFVADELVASIPNQYFTLTFEVPKHALVYKNVKVIVSRDRLAAFETAVTEILITAI